MLNDVIIDKLGDRLVKRIDEGNKYVLQEIGKTLKQIKDLTPEQAQKLSNVLKYGGDYNKIATKLAKITNMNKKDIYKIFDEVAKKDYRFAKQFYNYRKIKYIPYDKNTELKRLVRAIATRTADEYVNIAGSKNLGLAVINPKTNKPVFKVLKDAYNQIIDEAILNVTTGKETFDTMLKKTYNELDKGLQVVYKYKDKKGKTKYYKKNVISAVRQNMSDGLSGLQQEMQKEVGEQFKSDGVQITVVYNPAPDHAEVQGRQFSTIKPSENELSEFEKFQNDEDSHSYDGKFFPAEFEGRDRRSIGQYNCRHLIYSIILGVNEPKYSDKQLQEIIDRNNKGFEYEGKHYTNYEGSQLQRKLENEIRKNKLEQISAKARGDMDSVDIAQHKITALSKKYKDVCSAGGFTPRDDLLNVSGYRRINVNRATNTPTKPSVDANDNAMVQVEIPKYQDLTTTLQNMNKNKQSPERRLNYALDINKKRYDNFYFEQDKKMQDEINMRELIESWTGYETYLNPKTKTQNIRTPDFWLKDIEQLWDLKKINGNKNSTIENLFKTAKGQTENIILKPNKTKLTKAEIKRQVNEIFENDYKKYIKQVVLLDKENNIVLYYKR